MSEDVTLSKVGKTGFFVVMAPGFYLLACIAMFLRACIGSVRPEDAWTALARTGQAMPWPLTIAVVLLSYLLGILVRTISVGFVDRIAGWAFSKLDPLWKLLVNANRAETNRRNNADNAASSAPKGGLPAASAESHKPTPIDSKSFREALLDDRFPYQSMQRWLADKLQLKFFASVKTEDAHGTYNLWKMELCQLASAAFAYTQELEARVRLIAGMFWAGGGGALAAAAGMLVLWARHSSSGWMGPLFFQLCVSIIIGVVFCLRIRNARGDEVSFVFLSRQVLEKTMAKASGEIRHLAVSN
jgi:hypothetical protein